MAKDFDNVIAAWHLFLHEEKSKLRKIVNLPALRFDTHNQSAPRFKKGWMISVWFETGHDGHLILRTNALSHHRRSWNKEIFDKMWKIKRGWNPARQHTDLGQTLVSNLPYSLGTT